MGCDGDSTRGCSGDTVFVAFVFGVFFGAGAALLLTPEPGTTMRHRLLRGAKVAQEEFSDVATETRDALGVLGKDARQTLRRTATRFNAALEATKERLKNQS